MSEPTSNVAVKAAGNLGVVVRQRADGTLYTFDPAICPAEGTSTALGLATTIIDNTRTEPTGHWNGQLILITSGAQNGQLREIVTWDLPTFTFTVAPAFGGAIAAGVTYKVLAGLGPDIETALILARLGDPAAHTLASLTAKWGNIARSLDLILGAKWDGAGDLGTDIAAIIAAAGTAAAYAIVNSGLGFRGTVSARPGADQFTIPTLVGLGLGIFADATAPYYAFVLRSHLNVSGAPQGEMKQVTAYNSVTGVFTAPGFSVQVDAGDDVIILNPRIADIFSIRTQTDKTPNIQHETEWASTPTCDTIASANATDTTEQTITPTFPTGSTRVRAILIASVHVKNDAANTHNIAFKIQGKKNAGAYGDLLDLSASAQLGLVNLVGATDAWSSAIDVTALVDASASTYTFKFTVDSDNAGSVKYIVSYLLVLVYTV